MKYFLAALMTALTACGGVETASNKNGTHTLTYRMSNVADSFSRIAPELTRQAGQICPAGWERVSERTHPKGNLHDTEWTIRCL